ncbi:hypothetical protein YC2023_076401 [Brassica napus]
MGLPGQATSQEAARIRGGGNHFELCRTLSGSIDGKKENAFETHETSNRTHGDVGKVDMCVLNPAPRNPGWKWGRGGCYTRRQKRWLMQRRMIVTSWVSYW